MVVKFSDKAYIKEGNYIDVSNSSDKGFSMVTTDSSTENGTYGHCHGMT